MRRMFSPKRFSIDTVRLMELFDERCTEGQILTAPLAAWDVSLVVVDKRVRLCIFQPPKIAAPSARMQLEELQAMLAMRLSTVAYERHMQLSVGGWMIHRSTSQPLDTELAS